MEGWERAGQCVWGEEGREKSYEEYDSLYVCNLIVTSGDTVGFKYSNYEASPQ